MDNSIILDMAYGAGYCDDLIMYNLKEYNQLHNEFEKLCSEICSSMPEEKKWEVFKKFENLQSGMEVISNDEHFKRGFKLGLTIAAQSLLD